MGGRIEGGGGAKAEGQWGHQEETAAVGLVELARLKRGVCVCVCVCMQTGVASAAYHLLDQCSPEMQAGYILYSLESEEVGSQQHPRVYSIIVNFVLILLYNNLLLLFSH